MICLKCGTQFDEGIFCPECGTKYDEDAQLQIKKEKQEIELARIKAEQNRIDAERVEKEAELLRQQNENLRIQQEMKAQKEAEDKRIQEEESRTFNGVVYESIEEKAAAEKQYNEEKEYEQIIKKANRTALISFILAIAVFPLLLTFVLWIPALIVSFIFAEKALKEGASNTWAARGALIIDGVFIAIWVIGIIIGLCM